jgi:hypothetical protein
MLIAVKSLDYLQNMSEPKKSEELAEEWKKLCNGEHIFFYFSPNIVYF